jgi:ribosomal protein S8
MKRGLAMSYGLVRQSHHQKRVYCEVKMSLQTVLYLRFLRKNSMIYGYSLIPETSRVLVYLRYYRNRPVIKDIRLYSKQGHKRYLTRKNTFEITQRTNPGNGILVGTSKTSTLENAFLFRFDKHFNYANQNYGELMAMV